MAAEVDAAAVYYLLLLRMFTWPRLTKRQRRRLHRIDPLLYACIRGLGRPEHAIAKEDR